MASSPSPSPDHAPDRLVIATRESRLALWQAEFVQARLRVLYPACRVDLLPMTTLGDQLQSASLSKEGGKGLFIKELERALSDGRADLAVHSMKDVPVEMPEGFALAAITEREDPRDALVSNDYATLGDLPDGSVVGTSSLRRAAQVVERFPRLEIRPLRGNVNTRLAKLDKGDYAAIVLAASGLKRLGMESRIRAYFSIEDCLPAGGQGALGVECMSDRPQLVAAMQALVHRGTTICVRAERAVNRALGGNCSIPLGAYAEIWGETLRLRGLVASPDAKRMARAEATGGAEDPEALGYKVAGLLREQGADEILAALAS
jgi:hydroxymethylbilane synthase